MQVPVPMAFRKTLRKHKKRFSWGTVQPPGNLLNLLTLLFLCIFIFCTLYIITTVNIMDSELSTVSQKEDKIQQTRGYGVVEKSTCKIPKLDPFNPAILKVMENEHFPKKLDCTSDGNFPLFFDSFVSRLVPNRTNIQSISKTHQLQIRCCYRNLTNSDYVVGKCFPVSLDKPTEIPGEFISVECTFRRRKVLNNKIRYQYYKNVVDMQAFVHVKPEVVKRVMERQKKIKGEEPKDKLNVIVLGLESMSRMNFIRTMVKTREYLMKTLNAVEMEGFNKIGDNFIQNIGPLLTNDDHLSCIYRNSSERCPFIWKKYGDSGYHTLYAEDERFDKLNLALAPRQSQADYYFPQFAIAADKHIGHNKSCYGPRPAFQVMLDYMKKMTVLMKRLNENFFQFAWSSSLTSKSVNGGHLADKLLTSTLKFWHENGHLEKTVLILMSDQGQGFGDIRKLYQGQMEDRLPLMYFVLPSFFQDKYPKAYQNLMTNRKRLITSFDIYQTLHHLLKSKHLEDSMLSLLQTFALKQKSPLKPGISLFFQVPPARTCETAGVPINHCTCNHLLQPLPLDNPLLKLAANHIIKKMNSILSVSTNQLCAHLFLDKVLYFGVVSLGGYSRKGLPWIGYQVLLQTTPGYGTFEAMLSFNYRQNNANKSAVIEEWNWAVAGNILRINQIGNHSWCLEDKMGKNETIKNYCYCLPKEMPLITVDR